MAAKRPCRPADEGRPSLRRPREAHWQLLQRARSTILQTALSDSHQRSRTVEGRFRRCTKGELSRSAVALPGSRHRLRRTARVATLAALLVENGVMRVWRYEPTKDTIPTTAEPGDLNGRRIVLLAAAGPDDSSPSAWLALDDTTEPRVPFSLPHLPGTNSANTYGRS